MESVSIGIRAQPGKRDIPPTPLGPTREEIVAPRLNGEARMGSLDAAVDAKSDQTWQW